MTPTEFRRLALSFPETEEREHMNHPDFRAGGKVFATLGYPDKSSGMVKVTPVEQEMLMEAEPEVFTPCAGAWGRAGCTSVQLKLAKKSTIQKAVKAAWELAMAKQPENKSSKRTAKSSAKTKTTSKKR
jgi:hypothetical protein